MPVWTPRDNVDSLGIYVTDGLHFCATVQPIQLPTNNGNRPRESAWNRKVSTKPSTFLKIHFHGQSTKKHIVTAVQLVFLSPLVYQLTGFGQISALVMLQHLFTSYRVIYKINLEENAVNIMGPYDPTQPLACLIKK